MKDKAAFILQEVSKLYPDAGCELKYSNATELLVAIMLSQQATDISVNSLTRTLFAKYPTLEAFALAPLSQLESDLRTIGLFRAKAKNIKATAAIILDKHHGQIPATQEDLESLPGVGRKTANVYLAEWHNLPRIAVDTHVKRVAGRLGLADEGDTPAAVEKRLMGLYPESAWIRLHHSLLFFGRYFCKAKKPQCRSCPLIQVCLHPDPR